MTTQTKRLLRFNKLFFVCHWQICCSRTRCSAKQTTEINDLHFKQTCLDRKVDNYFLIIQIEYISLHLRESSTRVCGCVADIVTYNYCYVSLARHVTRLLTSEVTLSLLSSSISILSRQSIIFSFFICHTVLFRSSMEYRLYRSFLISIFVTIFMKLSNFFFIRHNLLAKLMRQKIADVCGQL